MANRIRFVQGSAIGAVLLAVAGCSGGGGGGGKAAASLSSAIQNRDLDLGGKTVDFSFSRTLRDLEPGAASSFVASGGQLAQSAELLLPEARVVRVAFDALVLPGETTFDVSGLLAKSGKAVPPVTGFPLGSTDETPPAVSAASATAISDAANDRLVVAFDDEMVPGDLVDPAHYVFEHPIGTAVPIAAIALDPVDGSVLVVFDGVSAEAANLQTGTGWRLLLSGLRDIGGNSIGVDVEVSGLVVGDAFGPVLLAATQNLLADGSGATLDFSFDEDLDAASALDLSHYAGSAGQVALLALIVAGGDLVRVVFDAPVVPGIDTVAVQDVRDLAGNLMVAVGAAPVGSTDAEPPSIAASSATTVSGFGNDVVTVSFSEAVLPQEAWDLSRYGLESPAGSPVSLAGASLDYDEGAWTATIVLAANLQTGASFVATATGIRDFAGNEIPLGASSAGTVGGDAVAPALVSATQNLGLDPLGRVIDLLFDEPIELASSPGAGVSASEGQALVSASELPGAMVVRLAFDAAVVPGSTTLTVWGVEDPAGNVGGALLASVLTADAVAPGVTGSTATTIPNGGNDTLTLSFTEQMVPSDVETAAAYLLESPVGSPVSLAGASLVYDPPTATVSMTLPYGTNLKTGDTYSLEVLAVRDVAGNSIGSAQSGGVVVGDTTPPTVVLADRNEVFDPSGQTLDVTFSEEVDAATAEDTANYTILGSGTPTVLSASLLPGGIVVRLSLGSAVQPGPHRLRTQDVEDLAGNAMPQSNGKQISP